MNLKEIKELIGNDIDKAFDELDDIFGKSNGVYNDLSREYVSRPENFSMSSFRSKLKRCVHLHFINEKNLNVTHPYVYLCNRQKQDATFQSHLMNKIKKIYTFLIHGDEGHGHRAMSQRFYMDTKKLNSNTQLKPLEINLCSIAQAKFRYKLIEKFSGHLGVDIEREFLSRNEILQQNIGGIYKKVKNRALTQKRVIIINFIIPKDWFPQDDINWFCNTFCNEQSIPEDAPKFYFYFLVEYRTTTLTGFFKKSKLKKCKKNILRKLRQTSIFKIDELSGVHYDDIDNWLSDHAEIKSPSKRKKIIKEKLKKAKVPLSEYYYMEDLLPPFNRIIKAQINTKL